MNIKQLAATALIIVAAILTAYFGVRFINAVFNDVEKKQSSTVQTQTTTGWSDNTCYDVESKVYYSGYSGIDVCHKLAAKGVKVIRIWEKPVFDTDR